MKYILSLLLIFTVINAEEEVVEEKKQKLTIGLGPYVQTQPYIGLSDIVIPSPVIFFDNGLFYIRWSRAGIYFLGNKGDQFSWGVSLTIQPRVNGYKPSDSSALSDMDERETTFEGGLALSASYKDTYIESMLLTDVLDRYESWIFKTEIGYDFQLYDFSFYPSLIVIYQSADFLNYYYGVTQEESRRTQYETFTPNDGVQFGAQTYIKYPFTKNLSALVNLRADFIPQTVHNSPIIESNLIYSGLFSLIYSFEY